MGFDLSILLALRQGAKLLGTISKNGTYITILPRAEFY